MRMTVTQPLGVYPAPTRAENGWQLLQCAATSSLPLPSGNSWLQAGRAKHSAAAAPAAITGQNRRFGTVASLGVSRSIATGAWNDGGEPRALRRPSIGHRATICIERVVRWELLGHVVVVVLGHRLEPRSQPVEAGRLRRELPGVGVRAAHNQCEGTERRVVELVFFQERVERAAVAMMAELDARDVVRDGALAFSNAHHLVLWHEQERRLLVDKSADQPGTRDPVDARFFTGDPLHASLPYFRLLVWSSAAFRTCATFTGSSFAQKCM